MAMPVKGPLLQADQTIVKNPLKKKNQTIIIIKIIAIKTSNNQLHNSILSNINSRNEQTVTVSVLQLSWALRSDGLASTTV